MLKHENVFISPHDDDVPFSIGSALLNGYFAHGIVITVFSVTNCTIDDSDNNIERVTELRKNENKSFYNSLNNIKIYYIDRLDAPLRLGVTDERVFQSVSPESDKVEAECLSAAIMNTLCDEGVIFAPLGLGGHVDHVLVHNAVCSLAQLGYPVIFYEDLPYAARMGASELECRVKNAQRIIGRSLKAIDIQTPMGYQGKRHALAAYKSQIDSHLLDEIMNYGCKYGDRVVERVWCDSKAFDRISKAAVEKSGFASCIKPGVKPLLLLLL